MAVKFQLWYRREREKLHKDSIVFLPGSRAPTGHAQDRTERAQTYHPF